MFEIDWWTLGLQTINFVVLVWLLQRFLYRPVREVIAARRRQGEEALGEAAKAREESEATRKRYETQCAALQAEHEATLKQLHEEMAGERQAALDAARREAEAKLAEAGEAVAAERRAAIDGLKTEIASLSAAMASRVLAGVDLSVLAPGDVDRAGHYLDGLASDALETLRHGLAGDGTVTVKSGAPLAADVQTRWQQALRSRFGSGLEVAFVSDPALLGGVDLMFPHTRIRLSWAAALDEAARMIGDDDRAG